MSAPRGQVEVEREAVGLFDGAVVLNVASPGPAGTYTSRTDFISEGTRRHAAQFRHQYRNLEFPVPPRQQVPKGISSGLWKTAKLPPNMKARFIAGHTPSKCAGVHLGWFRHLTIWRTVSTLCIHRSRRISAGFWARRRDPDRSVGSALEPISATGTLL